jgi:hypothetical protein
MWLWTTVFLIELALLGVALRGGLRGFATGAVAVSLLTTVGA